MTLPASGPISFNAINVELGSAGTATASLGQATYRALAGVPSGAIALSDFYGKANEFSFTITSDQTNANLATLATAAGWNGSSKLIATLDSGIYISSNSTGTPALTVNGAFAGGVELINNGFIVGMGGAGGNGKNSNGAGGTAGGAGGLALSVSSAISINNTSGTIGGGGGGGGGGGSYAPDLGGGGGGGGQTGRTSSAAGGAGSTYGGAKSRTSSPGSAGTVSAGGAGGLGAAYNDPKYFAGAGAAGATWGVAGVTGQTGQDEFGNPQQTGTAGGAAGAAVTGNSNITWIAFGTRLGSVS